MRLASVYQVGVQHKEQMEIVIFNLYYSAESPELESQPIKRLYDCLKESPIASTFSLWVRGRGNYHLGSIVS